VAATQVNEPENDDPGILDLVLAELLTNVGFCPDSCRVAGGRDHATHAVAKAV
jgi:hypothetical protein